MRDLVAVVLRAKEIWDEHKPSPNDVESPICEACDLSGWPCEAVQLASLVLHGDEIGSVEYRSGSWAWRWRNA